MRQRSKIDCEEPIEVGRATKSMNRIMGPRVVSKIRVREKIRQMIWR